MTDDFTPPPPLGPAPSGPARRADFRPAPPVRTRGRVPRWAWVAIVSGLVAIGAGVIAAVIADGRASALEPAAPSATGRLHSAQVVSGMCLASIASADGPAGQVTVVACDQPHHAEVVAAYSFESSTWPGAADARRSVLNFCASQLGPSGQLSRAAEHRTWVAWVPSERTWAAGDRTGLCIVAGDRPWTGRATDSPAVQPA